MLIVNCMMVYFYVPYEMLSTVPELRNNLFIEYVSAQHLVS